MGFRFTPTKIPDVIEIIPDLFGDERGAFVELFRQDIFSEHGLKFEIKQINHSVSQKNVLRGLHYQLNPVAQGKIVTVVKGLAFDVVVDLRKGSPTEKKWLALELSADKHNLLYVPRGFAHGFCVLTAETEILYYVDNTYSPEQERGIVWNDTDLAIEWPTAEPVLSAKDAAFPSWVEAEKNFTYFKES